MCKPSSLLLLLVEEGVRKGCVLSLCSSISIWGMCFPIAVVSYIFFSSKEMVYLDHLPLSLIRIRHLLLPLKNENLQAFNQVNNTSWNLRMSPNVWRKWPDFTISHIIDISIKKRHLRRKIYLWFPGVLMKINSIGRRHKK